MRQMIRATTLAILSVATQATTACLHTHMLSTISESQVAKIGQKLENMTDIKVLKLSDDQAKDFIPSSVKLLNHLIHLG